MGKRSVLDEFGLGPEGRKPRAPKEQQGPGEALNQPCIRTTGGAPVLMLDLVFRSGDRLAVGYAYLASVRFNPSKGIELEFISQKVAIAGRNLAPAYAALKHHACLALIEAPQSFDAGPQGQVFIESIRPTAGQ